MPPKRARDEDDAKTMEQVVFDLFKCCKCQEVMTDSILQVCVRAENPQRTLTRVRAQCSAGHTMCSACHALRQKSCHICGVVLSEPPIRCLVLEQARAAVHIKCKFCGLVAPGDTLKAHLSACPLNRVHCAFEGCVTQGTEAAVALHARSCDHRTVQCPLAFLGSRRACENKIVSSTLVEHLETEHKVQFRAVKRATGYNCAFFVSQQAHPGGGKWTNYLKTDAGDAFVFYCVGSAQRGLTACLRRLTPQPLTGRLTAFQQTPNGTRSISFTGDVQPFDSPLPITEDIASFRIGPEELAAFFPPEDAHLLRVGIVIQVDIK